MVMLICALAGFAVPVVPVVAGVVLGAVETVVAVGVAGPTVLLAVTGEVVGALADPVLEHPARANTAMSAVTAMSLRE